MIFTEICTFSIFPSIRPRLRLLATSTERKQREKIQQIKHVALGDAAIHFVWENLRIKDRVHPHKFATVRDNFESCLWTVLVQCSEESASNYGGASRIGAFEFSNCVIHICCHQSWYRILDWISIPALLRRGRNQNHRQDPWHPPSHWRRKSSRTRRRRGQAGARCADFPPFQRRQRESSYRSSRAMASRRRGPS